MKKTDLIPVELKCPNEKCQSRYIYGVSHVHVHCRKCGLIYVSELKMSILDKKARFILDAMAWNDELEFIADEDYYGTITRLERNYQNMKSYDVSEIETFDEQYKYCNDCGTCLECFKCSNCGHHFNKRKTCPECGSNKFTRTTFNKVLKSSTRICPECKSEKIKMTQTKNKTQCHNCSSKNLTKQFTKEFYRLTVTRKKAYQM